MPHPQWQNELQNGIQNIEDLARLNISKEEISIMTNVAKTYKVRVPQYFLNLIEWENPNDPIRKQVLPSEKELVSNAFELEDPIGDQKHSPVERLTHRYQDRVLLFPTYQCSTYCRFCFRKNFLRDNSQVFSRKAMDEALLYVKEHTEIQEVILSGGDPLMLKNEELEYIYQRLKKIEHIRMIRIHTRMLATLPQRVTSDLISAITGKLMVCLVTHINHPQEITSETAAVCQSLRQAGFMMLNQCVILRGVNDQVDTLHTLMRELVYRLGVKPYYLHHCDLARGTGHFRTRIDETQNLIKQLRGYLSGLCQPTYVLDIPGGYGKIPIGPDYVQDHNEQSWMFASYKGEACSYREIVM